MSITLPPPCKRPCWSGHYSFTEIRKERRGFLRVLTPIYRVRLNSDLPLCLHASDGRTYRPAMSFESDGASIPIWVQTIRVPWLSLKRDSFLRSSFLHDSGCIEHGLYMWNGHDWEFLPMTREKVDSLLYDGLLCDQANAAERAIIFGSVRAYSKLFVKW